MWQNDGENCGEMRLLDGFKVDVDTIDMDVNKGLLAFGAEEEGAVGGVVHEEVFYKDAGAEGVTNPDAKSLKKTKLVGAERDWVRNAYLFRVWYNYNNSDE